MTALRWGWSTWNKFQGNINEELIKGIADAMVESGLADAGYTYINLDDCWHGQRDQDGFIQADPKKFPSGTKSLADYIHGKSLKLGIYSDAGTGTCAGMPGSLGHKYQDTLQYARWYVDYLKEDWCNTTNINPITYNLNRQHFNLTDEDVSHKSTHFNTTVYNIRNLWTHKDEGKTTTKDKPWRKLTVPSRDVISYRLTVDRG